MEHEWAAAPLMDYREPCSEALCAAAETSREETGKSCMERRLQSSRPWHALFSPSTACEHTPGRQDWSRVSVGGSVDPLPRVSISKQLVGAHLSSVESRQLLTSSCLSSFGICPFLFYFKPRSLSKSRVYSLVPSGNACLTLYQGFSLRCHRKSVAADPAAAVRDVNPSNRQPDRISAAGPKQPDPSITAGRTTPAFIPYCRGQSTGICVPGLSFLKSPSIFP